MTDQVAAGLDQSHQTSIARIAASETFGFADTQSAAFPRQ
jgi:hypothetical protein